MSTTLTLDTIWREFHAQLYTFIHRRVEDSATAEDLMQDVFLRMHTHLDSVRDDTKLTSWMYQIARHAIIDHYRARHITEPLDSELTEREAETNDYAAHLAPSIQQLANLLPPHYRDAFLLTEVDGVSQVELAERLGISVSGAKSRVQRARALIRQMIYDCCHFEFDRRGGIIDYYPRSGCCRLCQCQS